MKSYCLLFSALILFSCNDDSKKKSSSSEYEEETEISGGHYKGAFTNGMKETYISFDVSEDGKKLKELTFKGYWRCDGTLEQTTIGPKKSFKIKDGKADGVIIEAEDSPAPYRYDLHATIDGDAT